MYNGALGVLYLSYTSEGRTALMPSLLGGNVTKPHIFDIHLFFFLYFVLNPETIDKAKKARMRL